MQIGLFLMKLVEIVRVSSVPNTQYDCLDILMFAATSNARAQVPQAIGL